MTASDNNAVSYSGYLALDELLSLQRLRAKHSDELLFIVVHQASELWFKVLLHELDALIVQMEANDVAASLGRMQRINALMRIVASQLSALDTLPPQRFAEFRSILGSSSGSQSVQFRALEALSGLRDEHFMHVLREHGDIPPLIQRVLARPTLQALFDGMLEKQSLTLEDLYTQSQQAPLYLLAESLLEYEQAFGLWRFLHVQLVERIIGPMTSGTGGTLGAKYLQRTISQRFFPKLWEVRSRIFAEGSTAGA
ncbi:MAG TPA: tryptophan 2,3-dioxygenase family protein [Gemmatimonadaceae bacterium]|nr:tryptophan 2,3-dioxygenase family protein [Gemmatimonadaceae bacterium]